MFARLKSYYHHQINRVQFYLINRWITGKGLSIVRLVKRDGVEYITAKDGSLHKIGRKTLSQAKPKGEINEPITNAANGTEHFRRNPRSK